MTIDTNQSSAATLSVSPNIDIEKSTKNKELLVTHIRAKFQKSIDEVITIIRVFSRNHRDERILEFKKRETAIKKDLLEIESKNPDDQILLNLKDKEFKLSYIPCDHPLIAEYEELTQVHKLSRDSKLTEEERAIRDKNSLFHNRPDLKEHRLELLKIGHNLDKAIKNDPFNFKENYSGGSKPVIYKKRKVVFKRRKEPETDAFVFLIRKKLEELGLDKIILPTREVWRERHLKNVKGVKSKEPLLSAVYIENMEENLFPFLESQYMYRNHSSLIEKSLEQFIILSCYYEVGDTCMGNEQFTQYRTFFNKKYNDPEGVFWTGSRCNFSNLPVQGSFDKDGKPYFNFVLCDVDIVLEPNESTVENLFNMFPHHKDLIIKLVKEHNPTLLKNRSKCIRVDYVPRGVYERSFTVKEYRREPRFNKDYSDYLKYLERKKFKQDGKLEGYEKLVNYNGTAIQDAV